MVNIRKLEAELWESADLLRAGSKLTSNQLLSRHQGAEDPRRPVPPPHRYRRLCQRHPATVHRAEKEHGGCAGRLHQQLHRLSGYHSASVLLQRFSDPLQRNGSQGRHAGQQI